MSKFVGLLTPTGVLLTNEEIVRCRDCKHFDRDAQGSDFAYPHICVRMFRGLKDDNGFCAWGEKRCDGSTSCS